MTDIDKRIDEVMELRAKNNEQQRLLEKFAMSAESILSVETSEDFHFWLERDTLIEALAEYNKAMEEK